MQNPRDLSDIRLSVREPHRYPLQRIRQSGCLHRDDQLALRVAGMNCPRILRLPTRQRESRLPPQWQMWRSVPPA